ncbi:ankyrin repeat-containing protein [Aspergillus arachidicola]|uniref:Ankyrin repeat-containing protein n=1 Tax=Aspergillus arachidicola TaxID=656916 RepID=A0A2G7G4J7_9EURO|nr:ankyrin repeat-containing protein [Aspergillus arachidicola]
MAAQADTKSKSHSEYTVGWICTLLKEQTAATSMLDQRHPGLPQPSNDPNTYTLGSIGKHNIVITCLPKGRYGANSAATVAMQMVRTFPSIKVGLMVGIGGGIPPKVRLGDEWLARPWNNEWQEYAATVAAAFAKELLEYVKPTDVDEERPVKDFLDQILDTVSRNGADIKVMRSKLARKEDQGILDWLTPINYGLKQSDIFRRQQPGTGQWLLHSAEFQNGSIQVTKHCFAQDSTVGIAYICCNFQRKDEQNIDHLLASLLKQLTESCFSLPESVRDLFNHNKVQRARPSLEDISRALHSVVAKYSRTFVVVDALDECQTSEGCRMKFLSELSSPQAKNGVNIFATSRVDDEIGKTLTKAIYLKVYARDDDIEMYLDERMRLQHSDIFDDTIRSIIKKDVIKAIDGI